MVIARLFADRLGQLPGAQELKDPKTRLQEHLQATRDAASGLCGGRGERRNPTTSGSWQAAKWPRSTRGARRGSSRRRAEQEAAQQVLERITADEVTAHD